MKTPDMSGGPGIEKPGSYKVEHLPGFDVVLNLDYKDKEDQDTLLNILRKVNTTNPHNLKFILELSTISSEDKNPRFYLKYKKGSGTPNENVDFLTGRDGYDPAFSTNFDHRRKSQYAFSGILNEILLAKKVKEIIASSIAQELATKYGFKGGIAFAEPIAGITYNDSRKKYLIYRNIPGSKISSGNANLFNLVQELKRLFLSKGIVPNDLTTRQFIVIEQQGQIGLNLIDTEVYTEK